MEFSIARRRGRPSGIRAAALGCAVLLLAGCGSAVTSEPGRTSPSGGSGSSGSSAPSLGDEPTRAPTSPATRAGACPSAPGPSTGPAAAVASVRLTVPPTGAPGATLTALTSILVSSNAARVVAQPAASGLAILRGGTLVGWAAGVGAAPVPLPLTAGTTRPAQVVPATFRLVACDGSPLPAGSYTAQAVVGYGSDPLDAGMAGAPRHFRLVSEPAPLTVS